MSMISLQQPSGTNEPVLSMPSVKTLRAKPLLPAYDYIVVGSGSGGCAVARRLIGGTDATVLLIEAGETTFDVPEIDDPREWVGLGRGAYDWGYNYAPAPHANGRVIPIPRGKGIGGSSAINAMMWYRGNPDDYNGWDRAGATGWSFADCLPYFRRCEDWQGGETDFRGSDGPLRIETSGALHPLAKAMMVGAGDLGIPLIDDPNGPVNEGAAPSNFNIARNKRWSAATGYLLPILDHERLTVLTGSLATGLIIEKGRCTGVRHVAYGELTETRVGTAVVLALGAIDTPRILMLSGIGPADDLSNLGIPVVQDMKGVGQNLQDHPLIQACVFRSKRPLGPKTDNGGGTMINWRSRPDLAKPDLHAFPVQGNSAEAPLRARYETDGEVFSFGFGLMDSKSVGYMKMLTSEPDGPLEIQPNFLAEAEDRQALVSAYHTIMDLAETDAMADWVQRPVAPDRRLDDSEVAEFIRDGLSTFFHTCGTCKMGSDEMAVTDPTLRVRGVDGLMIADASVIPIIPTCNTHAPVTMIGERAADFLMEAA